MSFYRDNATWLAVGLLLAFASSFGQTFFISLFAGEIKMALGLSDGAWGSIYTVATLSSAALLLQAGKLADTVPLRRLTFWLIACFGCAMVLMAAVQSVWLLILAVFGLRFCGQGMMSQISMTAMARWFRANRGRAVGFAVMGYPLGEALLPSLVVMAIVAVGWRWSWVLFAIVLVVILLPALMSLMTHDRTPQGEGPVERAHGIGGRHWRRREVLRHGGFWALVPGIISCSFIGTVIFFHQIHVSELRDWPLVAMALGYPAYAVLSVISAWISGHLVDRIGPIRLLPFYLLPMTLGVGLLILPGEVGIWYVILGLIGATQGINITLSGTIWATLYGTDHIGAIKALATSVMVLASAIGPGITGLVIDAGINLADQAWVMTAFCVLLSLAYLRVASSLRSERDSV